jgi:hypothetical protein
MKSHQQNAYERQYDADAVRKLVTCEIARSSKSREQIAEEMQGLLAIPVTARMIGSFTAESKELHRWPGSFDIAFCEAVGSYKLLAERVKRAGFRMIGPNEEELLRIGRAFIAREKAQAILDTKAAQVRS